MIYSGRRTVAFVVIWVLFAIGLAPIAKAQASITISATVAGVRTIQVDVRGHITQITSNTRQPVTPVVYCGDETSALTPAILKEYTTIMAHIDTARAGTIYTKQQNTAPFWIISQIPR